MRLWAHEQRPELASTSSEATVGWTAISPSVNLKHDVSIDFGGTGSDPSASVFVELLYRVCCHIIIDNLPREALADAVEGLRDATTFYLTPSAPVMLQPTVNVLEGRLAPLREAVPFQFSED